MYRGVTPALTAVTVMATAVACAHTVTGAAQRADIDPADADRGYGYLDDRCGRLDDDTVRETLGATDVTRPFSGAVCQYILARESGTGAATTIDVTFSWFESGTLERERGLAVARGATVTDIVVERHRGFSARRDTTGAACSVTATAGTGVLSWWVQSSGDPAGDPCLAAEKLLTATLRSDL